MEKATLVKTRKNYIKSDRLIFTPDDVDLSRSPLRGGLTEKTQVLGAFNPGLCRLPNGNLLMMVRVAEALSDAATGGKMHCIRWDAERGFVCDGWPLAEVAADDPRKFRIRAYGFPVYALTSLSWLLPVELNADGSAIERVHYDKSISPRSAGQEYGIEDARISTIGGRYYMTTCCVSAGRHSTMLYISDNGLDWRNLGVVLDHQNKDMLLFEGKIGIAYAALTRPLGECYFASGTLIALALCGRGDPDGFFPRPAALETRGQGLFTRAPSIALQREDRRGHATGPDKGWMADPLSWRGEPGRGGYLPDLLGAAGQGRPAAYPAIGRWRSSARGQPDPDNPDTSSALFERGGLYHGDRRAWRRFYHRLGRGRSGLSHHPDRPRSFLPERSKIKKSFMAEVSLEHISKTYAGDGSRTGRHAARKAGAPGKGSVSPKAIDDISFAVHDKGIHGHGGPFGLRQIDPAPDDRGAGRDRGGNHPYRRQAHQ